MSNRKERECQGEIGQKEGEHRDVLFFFFFLDVESLMNLLTHPPGTSFSSTRKLSLNICNGGERNNIH